LKVSEDRLAALTRLTPEQLEARRRELEQRRAELRERHRDIPSRKDTLAKRKALVDTTELLKREMAQLRPASMVRVRETRNRTEPQWQPVWVECYVSEPGENGAPIARPAVRLVNKDTYRRHGNTIVPTASGEALSTVIDPDQRTSFEQLLKGSDEDFRKTHYLYFVVRPDAYSAFRELRRMAWKNGWRVRWDPIEAGEVLTIGPRDRATAGAAPGEEPSAEIPRPGATGE
jgi:hypothetical protein